MLLGKWSQFLLMRAFTIILLQMQVAACTIDTLAGSLLKFPREAEKKRKGESHTVILERIQL